MIFLEVSEMEINKQKIKGAFKRRETNEKDIREIYLMFEIGVLVAFVMWVIQLVLNTIRGQDPVQLMFLGSVLLLQALIILQLFEFILRKLGVDTKIKY